MLKAGKLVLLTLLSLGVLGATGQSYAQEKLLALPNAYTSKSHTCTSIDDYLVTLSTSCENTGLTQEEIAVKLQAQINPDEVAEFSYSTEPTYYARSESDTPPTPTETPLITQTVTPQATNNTTPSQTPADNIPADSSSLNSDIIFDMINAHRAQIGKSPFQKDAALCTLAQTRSFELHDELFVNHNLHSGLYNRNLPYWITEDAKWGSNEAGTVKWWLNSPIHRHAIEGDYTYSCGACNGTQCSQLFTSYTPKSDSSIAIKQ